MDGHFSNVTRLKKNLFESSYKAANWVLSLMNLVPAQDSEEDSLYRGTLSIYHGNFSSAKDSFCSFIT